MTTETEEAVAAAKEAVAEQRPLSVSAGRNLLKIVKNDFESLKANLELFKAEETQRRVAEIRGMATENKIEEVRELRQKTDRKIRRLMEAYKDACREIGMDPGHVYMPAIPDPKDVDIQKRISKAMMEIDQTIRVALQTAEVKFREAERLVLLATVTADAEKILSAIPSAQSLMAEAYAQRAERKALGGRQ